VSQRKPAPVCVRMMDGQGSLFLLTFFSVMPGHRRAESSSVGRLCPPTRRHSRVLYSENIHTRSELDNCGDYDRTCPAFAFSFGQGPLSGVREDRPPEGLATFPPLPPAANAVLRQRNHVHVAPKVA